MVQREVRQEVDTILDEIKNKDKTRGNLKIFFSYAAGVGKTYAMLDEAREKLKSGNNVMIGYVEPHIRPETMELVQGIPMLPPTSVKQNNHELKEFDLDGALRIKPDIILVDELAHTNVKGLRNKKRYQDVEELLHAGIDVYTTLDVQHIESLNNVIEDITKVTVKETVPDYIFEQADYVKLIDTDPEELIVRLKKGKICSEDRVESAMKNFFTRENLSILREIAMRLAADRLSNENQNDHGLAEKMANSKFLVCFGTSPSSAKCIRWTARAAEAFHAPWAALYVENEKNKSLARTELSNLKANMELAETLGGELVTLNGHNVAEVISEYAKVSGITNIVIGKSRNSRSLKNIFTEDLEDSLIALLPTIEVHIIPGSNSFNHSLKKEARLYLGDKFSITWIDIIKTAGILAAATGLSYFLVGMHLGEQNIMLVYILAVMLISVKTKGYTFGILSSFISVVGFDYFFTRPYLTLYTLQPEYPLTFAIMLIVATATSTLTIRIKEQLKLTVNREHRTEMLYEINKKLLATRGLENIVKITNNYIVKLFHKSVIFYTADPSIGINGILQQAQEDSDSTYMHQENEKAVAQWVFANQKRAGTGTDTLTGANGFYMPVISQGNVFGVLGISCIDGELNHDKRQFLRMIASQVAMALERQHLSNEQRRILVSSEKEKMRSNLLRAISHDLRTPLTGILGASSAILDNYDRIDRETNEKLLKNIKDESQWLIRMVENLLSITRIREGTMNVTKAPEAAEEIVAEAISRIRKRFPETNLTVKVPEKVVIVPMDGTLIVQVLINLVENAIKHTPSGKLIEVNVREGINSIIFEVSDSGEGIPEEELSGIFEYVPGGKGSSDSTRGMGIGLSLCMSIIKAHDGSMEAKNKKDGGAVFRFYLPMEEGE
ncbi:two-component sensor histidine kinase [Anaerocolumna cellulosilytica]|uniref:histidine kinase n=1 Tax=Anaerocolumna cellulosilytica TaxID=433286 RepID=A0A6S6R3Y6_9FIRM|nr:sensor histidine kinase KdpD [Anaerocolumna cellulosilytica]MBB5195527.1 two-component system sensor histidine kinase KdpD [Anaerocolumna cellulosilytica]BCJ93768.1 two-component sensor histidine kinase [Anaerocolumna cellulosilytica]